MTALTFTRFELLRTLRNKRFFMLSIGLPLGIYLLVAGANRGVTNLGGTGLSAPLYFMVGLASFGAIAASLSSGVRISADRAAGWTRQLRLTPLPAGAYLRSKVISSYLLALVTIGLLYAAGVLLGVRLPPEAWLRMTLLLIVGLVPFAALGIVLGHALSVDAVGPAMGGATSVLAFLGGAWFPIGDGVLADIARWMPSYWLVQASRAALGGGSWALQGWLVVAAWSVVLAALAGYAYRRDTARA
jgi:ABC-2 type transport system permease protein